MNSVQRQSTVTYVRILFSFSLFLSKFSVSYHLIRIARIILAINIMIFLICEQRAQPCMFYDDSEECESEQEGELEG